MRSTIPWWVALLLTAQVAVASAQAGGADVVYLPGGGRLRGTVEVYEPGQRVVVLLPDGSRRTLAPGEFERVQFADAATGGEAPAPPPPAPSPPAAEPIVPSQQQLDALDRAAQPLGEVEPPAASVAVERHYGDGRGDQVAWDATDPRLVARPEGMLHFGVQLSALVAVNIGYRFHFQLGGELAPYLDVRLARELQIRLAGVLGLQESIAGGGGGGQLGVFWMGLRPMLGFVVSPLVAIRIGGEVGFETVIGPEVYGGGNLELALRFLDQEQLEIVFHFAAQRRGEAVTASWVATDTIIWGGVSPRLMIGLGYVF